MRIALSSPQRALVTPLLVTLGPAAVRKTFAFTERQFLALVASFQ